MKPSAIHRQSPSRQPGRPDERGVTIILVAFSMVGILAMAVLSIDVVTLYLARLEAQRSADAAALTAARMISIYGLTGDPNNTSWDQLCGAGESSPASLAARAVAFQNTVGGISATTVMVKYSAGTTSSESCSGLPAAFGVNPMVTVQVTRTGMPTLFSRMWRSPSQSVSATATAEAFNPSNTGTVGNSTPTFITPVQPRCAKPWIVPNLDPGNPGTCTAGGPTTCLPFIKADSSIQNPGISKDGSGTSGVIGETFTLFADCGSATPCATPTKPPKANISGGIKLFNGNDPPPVRNLEYVPGQVPITFAAVPSCADDSDYQKAIAGCDQTTVYQCGVQSSKAATPNLVDLKWNPGGETGDTPTAAACLINQPAKGGTGQDSLDTDSYPFQITGGSGNPVTGVRGSLVSSSSSIVTLPIYDGAALNDTGTTPVTIVGFLQVFINQVNDEGTLKVTVLNVAGCGNGTKPTGNPVTGSSPVPIRLITPP
jgi:hypothetical protein